MSQGDNGRSKRVPSTVTKGSGKTGRGQNVDSANESRLAQLNERCGNKE